MNVDIVESKRVNLSICFLTLFVTLFLGVDFLPRSIPILIVKFYALVSSLLFFSFLIFTAVGCKYKSGQGFEVGIGLDKISLNNKEIEEIRKWSFNAGINCVFHIVFVPFCTWFPLKLDSLEILFVFSVLALAADFQYTIIQSLLKRRFTYTILFTLLLILLCGFSLLLNNEAKKIIVSNNNKITTIMSNDNMNSSKSSIWPLAVNFVADECVRSYIYICPKTKK
jgi:hypothetical protein